MTRLSRWYFLKLSANVPLGRPFAWKSCLQRRSSYIASNASWVDRDMGGLSV